MEGQNLIGVDVGTTSVRAGVANLTGELLGVESESLNLISRGKDHVEQDVEKLPRIVSPVEQVGGVVREFASQTRLLTP